MRSTLFLTCLYYTILSGFVLLPFTLKGQKKVYVLQIRQEIDPAMNRYVTMALQEATDQKADYILIDMDTYGGALSDADEIRKAILDFNKPVFVFINKNAASAGALISIACDSIYMAPGSNIGAATVVTQDGTPAPDKYQSYMRSLMRSTAEVNYRNPQIAEKMVGEFVDKDSSHIGKVLSFSTEEAIANNFCEAKVNTIEEIFNRNQIGNYSLITYQLSAIEKLIAFFLNPYLKSVLILLIIAGIYFKLQSPGIGFPLLTSVVAALLYFVPSYMAGLAENWEILLFLGGIILIVLEVFVIPGFGIAGILGIVLSLGGLILVMLNNDFLDFTLVDINSFYEALFVVLIAMLGGIIFVFLAAPKFMQSRFFKNVTLQESFTSDQGYTSNFISENMIGKKGVAYTVLRPSGKIKIEGAIYDAFAAQGEYIDKGTEVTVIEHMATSLRVTVIKQPL